jgi:hypothetical protein
MDQKDTDGVKDVEIMSPILFKKSGLVLDYRIRSMREEKDCIIFDIDVLPIVCTESITVDVNLVET